MRPLFLSSFILCLTLSIARAIDADFDTLIPYPRKLSAFGDAISLEKFQILTGRSNEAKIGAAEINQRIKSLGGKPIPLVELKDDTLPKGNLIIIATDSALKSRPGKTIAPHEQGYVIRPEKLDDGSLRIWLIGSDPLGTLYAAVTARQLIQAAEKSITLRPATISDWPDFKKRQLGYPMSEPRRGLWYALKQLDAQGKTEEAKKVAKKWVSHKKTHYDWMLRAKVNWAWSHSFLKADEFDKNTAITRAALKEVHDYGLARGIRTMVSGTTSIGDFPADKDNPDFKNVAYHSSHHRYFCWSRLKYHHKKAQHAARMIAESGYKGYYIHAADGGGWRNPGLWNDRCDLCKKTYGDDHAKADAVVFGIYYDAIRKLVPDCEFVTVVYPYSPEQLDPDLVYLDATAEMGPGPETRKVAEERTRKLAGFVKQLDALLPDDIFVTIRESERAPLDRMRATWGKRRFHSYFEYAFWKGWQPYFTTSPMWTRSMYYPEYDDILFGNLSGLGWREFTELLGAERAWNVNLPGATDFSETAWKDLGTRLAPPPERKTFASRAARFWFGDKMGPPIAPAFGENISHAFIAFPEKILERSKLDDPLALMQGQAVAARKAALSLDIARAIQEKEAVLTGEDHGFFLNMLLMTHGAAITADHRARMMQIDAAIKLGKRAECIRLLDEAKATLEDAGPKWQALYGSIPKDKLMIRYTHRRSPHSYLSNLDFSEFEKEVEDLTSTFEQDIIEQTIPSWFMRDLTRRRVRAGRNADAIQVDGKLSEAAWKSVQTLSNFIRTDRLQLESRETQVRFAFDETNLYLAVECHNPGEKESFTFKAAANREWKETIEVTIPNNGETDLSSNLAKIRTSTNEKIWTIEMAIPIKELGFKVKAGRSCVVWLTRRSKSETVSYGLNDRATVIEFTDDPRPLTPVQIGLKLDDPQFRHETIGTGSGTVISGGLSLLTDRPLHQVKVSVEADDGIRPLGKKSFPTAAQVPLIWRLDETFVMRFPEEVPGVVTHFKITADEGEWIFTRRFGSPRRAEKMPADLLTAGLGESGKALNQPIHFPSPGPAETPWPEGTIEFWIKPNWKSEPRNEGPRGTIEHALVHMGPIRPDHPTLSNHNSLALVHGANGYLSASIASSRYRSRSTGAAVRDWKPGEWHHVAMQWKLVDENEGGKTSVQLYLDGRLAGKETLGTPKDTLNEPLSRSKFRPPIQIGSMNTGVRPADAAIDELRISSVRRYGKSFEPIKRFTADDKTLSLFHFDTNLDAAGPGKTKATVGAAQ